MGWLNVCAVNGLDVVLVDIDQDVLEKASEAVRAYLDRHTAKHGGGH